MVGTRARTGSRGGADARIRSAGRSRDRCSAPRADPILPWAGVRVDAESEVSKSEVSKSEVSKS